MNKQYFAVFDTNGGSGTMADQAFTYDQAQTLMANTFTRALRACRAYFQFADEIGSEARDIRLDFGDDSETTGIFEAEANSSLFTLHFQSGTTCRAAVSMVNGQWSIEEGTESGAERRPLVLRRGCQVA